MSRVEWRAVLGDDFRVPPDVPLGELTEELTTMLDVAAARTRDDVAVRTLLTWIERGVYDDLLPGLGDGMVAGLRAVGERGVFRRANSARVVGACIARDNGRPLVLGGLVLRWGDALAAWLLGEDDLRGWVPGAGWACAVGQGADALAVLAGSPHLAAPELTVLLDVVAERLLLPTPVVLQYAEIDALARTVTAVLRRERVPAPVLEPWVNRIVAGVRPSVGTRADPAATIGTAANGQAFLRALYLHLALEARPPTVRADLMLVLVDHLRATSPALALPDQAPRP